jgi:hypothetical protein
MRQAQGPTPDPGPAPAAPSAVPPVDGNAAVARPRPGVKATVGTAMAAATLAAVTVLAAPVISQDPAAILASPVNSASSRIAGVHEDIARAVALNQVTPEQAAFLEKQLVRRIQAGTQA